MDSDRTLIDGIVPIAYKNVALRKVSEGEIYGLYFFGRKENVGKCSKKNLLQIQKCGITLHHSNSDIG